MSAVEMVFDSTTKGITNIIDTPMCSVAYVQNDYVVSDLVNIWY